MATRKRPEISQPISSEGQAQASSEAPATEGKKPRKARVARSRSERLSALAKMARKLGRASASGEGAEEFSGLLEGVQKALGRCSELASGLTFKSVSVPLAAEDFKENDVVSCNGQKGKIVSIYKKGRGNTAKVQLLDFPVVLEAPVTTLRKA